MPGRRSGSRRSRRSSRTRTTAGSGPASPPRRESARSACGPRSPGPSVAVSDRRSTVDLAQPAEVERDQAARTRSRTGRRRRPRWCRPRTGPPRSPPAAQISSTRPTSATLAGQHDRVGGLVEPPGCEAGSDPGSCGRRLAAPGARDRLSTAACPTASAIASGSGSGAGSTTCSSAARARRLGLSELGAQRGQRLAAELRPPLRVPPAPPLHRRWRRRIAGRIAVHVQRPLDPGQGLVEALPGRPPHHRRAEPRQAPQPLAADQRDQRALVSAPRAGSRARRSAGSSRTASRRSPAPRRSARRRSRRCSGSRPAPPCPAASRAPSSSGCAARRGVLPHVLDPRPSAATSAAGGAGRRPGPRPARRIRATARSDAAACVLVSETR